jgi:membrane protease YdiL (CAAX protease family)
MGSTLEGDVKLLNFLSLRKFFNLEEETDVRPIIVMITVALCLCIINFLGKSNVFLYFFTKIFPGRAITWDICFWSVIYWAIWSCIGYFVIPALIIKFIFKEKIRSYGLKIAGISKHLWIYALLYFIVLIGVVIASFQQSFVNTYPFVQLPPGAWHYFILFEFFYFMQFFTLEFFFRGFMTFGLEKKFSYYSIFIMIIPYCMIHFKKPFLEAVASIIAGTVLGMIALRTRSIWYGVLIHCSVALSMDILSLIRKDCLFVLFK